MGLLDYLGFGSPVRLNLPTIVTDAASNAVNQPPAMFEVRASREPFLNLATGQGTDRDPDSSEQPRWTFEPLRREYLESMVRMDGLARRVVEIPPDDALQNGADSWTVLDRSEDPIPLSDVRALEGLHVKIHLADLAARWKGDSAILICAEESGDFSDARQAEPLDLARVTGLRDLVVLEKADLYPAEQQRELGAVDGPSIGETTHWTVRLRRRGISLTLRVHSSRLVFFHGAHVGANPTVSATDAWGHDSVLEGAVRALMGIHTARRGRSKVWNKLMTWWLVREFPKERDTLTSGHTDVVTKLKERASLLKIMTTLGLGVLDKGETIQQLNAPAGGLGELSEAQVKDLALATGIPMGRWLGEIGGWSNGESYKADWRATVASYMKRRYEGPLRRIYSVAYAARGPVPAFEIVFNPLEAMDPIQAAEERLLLLQGDQIAAELYPALVPALVRSRAYSGWQREVQPMTAEEIARYEGSLEPDDFDDLDDEDLEGVEDPDLDVGLEGDASTTVPVPVSVRRKARLGLKLSTAFRRGGTAAGKLSARLLASGRFPVARLPKLTSFFERHDVQVRRNNERSGAGWGPKNPSPRYIAWLLWGDDEGWDWAKRERARLERVVTDADFSGSALLSFSVAEEDVAAWRDLQAAVAALAPLEGYDPGDPAPAEPHHTLLFFGGVKRADRPAALKALISAFATVTAPTPIPLGVRVFPPGEDGRRPVVLELKPTGLSSLYRRALVALTPFVSAEQYPRYRPHWTLGFAHLTPEQIEEIEALPIPSVLSPLPELNLVWQGQPALHLPLE